MNYYANQEYVLVSRGMQQIHSIQYLGKTKPEMRRRAYVFISKRVQASLAQVRTGSKIGEKA